MLNFIIILELNLINIFIIAVLLPHISSVMIRIRIL